MWYQARGNSLREPGAVRPAESNASSRALVSKLGLPVGSHRGLGIGVVDELGRQLDETQGQLYATQNQLDGTQSQVKAKSVGKGYSRVSKVLTKDGTRTRRKATIVWKKVTRLFGAADECARHLDVDNLAPEPEKRRKGLDLHWIGPPSALVGA
jgi:hypothetical protein